jgi:protein-S-isoprenylcysteine O-methyltransferase Ste14
MRWFTLVGILCWYIVYWRGGGKVLEDVKKAMSLKNSSLDATLMIVIAICSFVITGTGLIISVGRCEIGNQSNLYTAVGGWLATYIGIAGTFYGRCYLGRYWTAETSIRNAHQVVEKGPYGIVRHPIYTFAIMMYVGVGMEFPAWWNLLAVSIIVIAYVFKTKDEDEYLKQNLPDYCEYQQKVPHRLVPGLW